MKSKWIVVLLVVAAGFVFGSVACRHAPDKPATTDSQKAAYYTCPMHPSVKSDTPGVCHICGMDLVPVYTNAPVTKP
jgi:Cu(I)/Ag(I) efflux system membrane fusion protein